ncbi:hypothetical protein VNO77_18235 [Canavalia gladiata]|uniref:X8 domain-containing protein n=1 Tax=Canavalia gladiata TaxID=3824 RepID=A0AAN9LKF5_CANGL
MAKELSLRFLFLSFLIICCSGTLVDFSYPERGGAASSISAGTTFLQKNKIQSQIRFSVTDYKILSNLIHSNVSVDFFLNESLVEHFGSSTSSVVSWLKAHLINILPQVDIRSIIVSCGRECLGQNEISSLLSVLESIHSFLSRLHISREVKVSVAFPLSFLENLNESYEYDLLRIFGFVKKINSFIMIEGSIDGELSLRDHFVQSVIERANLVSSILPCKDVPIVMTIKTQVIPGSMELAQFNEAVSKYLETRSHVTKRIVALYALHTTEDLVQQEHKRDEEEEIFPLSLGEKISKVHIRRSLQDTTNSTTTVFPTNPTPPPPVINPPDTPTIITVPSNNPVTVPSTTPVPMPPTNPANPGSSYPPPTGIVPLTPPPNTNAQAMPGQSWCVAKTGVPETSLQSALDYACGMPSVDCSQIQQGGTCYNPNSIQNHASFAFNSYYQKNPASTSCDFGGTATVVNTNPSTGSCIYPSSSGAGTSGSGTPPSVLGSPSPSDLNTSGSAGLRPFLGCMVLVISLVTRRLNI